MKKQAFTFNIYLENGNDLVQIKVIASSEGEAKSKAKRVLCSYVDVNLTGLYLADVENY